MNKIYYNVCWIDIIARKTMHAYYRAFNNKKRMST